MVAEPYDKSYTNYKRCGYRYGTNRVDGYGDPNGYPSQDRTGHVSKLQKELVYTGYKNPKWRSQIMKHQQAGTDLTVSDTVVHKKAMRAEEIWTHTWKPGFSPYGGYPLRKYSHDNQFTTDPYYTASNSHVAKANNEAVTAYIEDANAARQVIQSGETIGEFAQLVRLVKSPGRSLRRGMDAYLRTVKKRASRKNLRRVPRKRRREHVSKIASDAWLEYKFGWSPLISEIDAAIDYINEENPADRLPVRSIQGVGRNEVSEWVDPTKAKRTYVTPGVLARIRGKAKIVVVYRGQVSMSSSAAGYVAEKVGFAPDQWLPTAWELVPYSFLIDYFSNIGDIIYAFSFPKHLLPWTMKTVIVESLGSYVDNEVLWNVDSDTTETARSYVSIDKVLHSLGDCSIMTKTVERTRYTGSFIPDLEFSIPGSGTKWINIAALLVGSKKLQNRINSY